MTLDVVDLRGFYATALGAAARRHLLAALRRRWGGVEGLTLAGLGYAAPYLEGLAPAPAARGREPVPGAPERVIGLLPAAMGAVAWPLGGPSRACLVDPGELPLREGSVDRLLVVHALEEADRPGELLEECFRALSPAGRIVVVAPNRRGVWARADTTPFGVGHPYSRGQLTRLLGAAGFTPLALDEALWFPPVPHPLVLRAARALERLGRALALPLAGVHVAEATKLVQRPVPARRAARARLAPAMVPALRRTPLEGPRPHG